MIDLAALPWESETIQKLCGYMQVDGGQFACEFAAIDRLDYGSRGFQWQSICKSELVCSGHV